ncbi:hypothetical protein KAI46_01865 [bacterium]|nr:hypothetical protein [bacterium]
MAKKKSKAKRAKGNDNVLETVLRFEIVVTIFILIGLYYFLSFSPIRMPTETIASAPETIAPLPPESAPQVEPKVAVESLESKVVVGREPVLVVAVLPQASAEVAGEQSRQPESQGQLASINVATSETLQKGDSSEIVLQDNPETKLVAEVETDARRTPVSEPVVVEDPSPESLVPAKKIAPAVVRKKSKPVPLEIETVVVGAYVLETNLLQNRLKLEALNLVVKTEVEQRPTPMIRVCLGPFQDRYKALEMMIVARNQGDDPFLQVQNGLYNVIIGSFYLKSSVVAWENMYRAAGLEPKVQELSLKMPHSLLLLDGPQVQQDADAVLVRLRAAGFPGAHLR